MNVARVGGNGGISIPIGADVAPLRARLSEAKQIISASEKELKIRPGFDFETSTINREVRKVVRKIETEMAREKVTVRLHELGIADAARGAGVRFNQAPAAPSPVDTMGRFIGSGRAMLRGAGLAAGSAFAGIQAAQLSGAVGGGMAMMGSADPMTQMAGGVHMMEGAKAIPILGRLAGEFDQLIGITATLRSQMQSLSVVEAQAVRAASITRDPLAIARARGNQELREFDRQTDSEAASVWLADHALGFMPDSFLPGNRIRAGRARARAAVAGNVNNEIRIAGAERARLIHDTLAEGEALSLARLRRPHGAEWERLRAAIGTEQAMAAAAGMPADMQKAIGYRNQERVNLFNSEWGRAMTLDQYSVASAAVASQMRIQNRGQSLYNDQAVARIASIEAGIFNAPREGGFRERAVTAGIAELRALKAGLLPGTGGIGGAGNPNLVAYGAPSPREDARRQAIGLYDAAIARFSGDMGARDLYAGSGGMLNGQPLDRAVGILAELLKTVEVAKDYLMGGSKGPLLRD